MVTDILNAFTGGITGLASSIPSALKEGFTNLIYEDPTATTKTLSGFAQFGLVFGGIALGAGLVYLVVNMIRR